MVIAVGAKPNRYLLQPLNHKDHYFDIDGGGIRMLQAGNRVQVRTAVKAFADGFRGELEA